MINYTLSDLPYVLTGDVHKVKTSGFLDAVAFYVARGYTVSLIYQLNKSVYVRLVRIGRLGLINKDVVVRTYPCSERVQRDLIVALEDK